MRKLLGILTTCLLCFVLPNVSMSQGTSGTADNFAVNSTATGSIGGGTPNHWYKLVTNGDGNISLNATALQTNGNTYMNIYLYDSVGLTQLGTSSNYASSGGPSFTVNGLAKGTYYCLINGTDAFSNTYSFTNSL